jgi:hypothetical protein
VEVGGMACRSAHSSTNHRTRSMLYLFYIDMCCHNPISFWPKGGEEGVRLHHPLVTAHNLQP